MPVAQTWIEDPPGSAMERGCLWLPPTGRGRGAAQAGQPRPVRGGDGGMGAAGRRSPAVPEQEPLPRSRPGFPGRRSRPRPGALAGSGPGHAGAAAAGAAARARGVPGGRQPLVVDLRSDTVTRPCAAMRRAMARAAVGDDDYGEDPAVNELQRRAAATLGTESALFMPTATMANLIAVMCHCQRRGAQLFLGRDAHLHVYEHGGAAQVAGVQSQALPDLPNDTFDLEQLELTIREAHGSQCHPCPELICLENTHSSVGGRALPLTYLRQVRGLADRYGLRVHMDSARLMNAAVAQGVEPAQIAQHCDSVSLCFSKGLGAPAGAVLAGSGQLVAEAWRVRKLLGGGMRQAGAAQLGLQHAEGTLHRDHEHAQSFAEGIQALGSLLCSVSLAAVETNTVMVNVQGAWPSPAELCDRLRAVSEEEEEAESGQVGSVLLLPGAARALRAVWHRGVSARHTELARRKLEFVARKCQEELALGLHAAPPGTGGA